LNLNPHQQNLSLRLKPSERRWNGFDPPLVENAKPIQTGRGPSRLTFQPPGRPAKGQRYIGSYPYYAFNCEFSSDARNWAVEVSLPLTLLGRMIRMRTLALKTKARHEDGVKQTGAL